MAKSKDVKQRQTDRYQRRHERAEKRPAQHAEEQEKDHDGREPSAGHEPEEVALQAPCFAGGVVRAVRFRKAQLVCRNVAHWKEPTSTVELSMPNAVKSAFTMIGAPAMIRPPMIDSLPASVSPRRMATAAAS